MFQVVLLSVYDQPPPPDRFVPLVNLGVRGSFSLVFVVLSPGITLPPPRAYLKVLRLDTSRGVPGRTEVGHQLLGVSLVPSGLRGDNSCKRRLSPGDSVTHRQSV